MKYKNYRNPLTGDNRIYSVDEISKMPLSEVLNKKTEIKISQDWCNNKEFD